MLGNRLSECVGVVDGKNADCLVTVNGLSEQSVAGFNGDLVSL